MAQKSWPWDWQPGGPKPPYEALGEVTAAFAALKLRTNEVVWHLANPKNLEASATVTAGCSARQVIELGLALLKTARISALVARSGTALLTEARDLNKRRNEATHSMWFLGDVDGTKVWMRSSVNDHKTLDENRISDGVTEVSHTDLISLRNEMLDLVTRLVGFSETMYSDAPAEPRS